MPGYVKRATYFLSRSGGRQAAKNGRSDQLDTIMAYPHLETVGPLGVDVICGEANNTG